MSWHAMSHGMSNENEWRRAHLQDFPEEAQVFVEEGESGAEVHHAAEHERMIRVVPSLVACRPTPL